VGVCEGEGRLGEKNTWGYSWVEKKRWAHKEKEETKPLYFTRKWKWGENNEDDNQHHKKTVLKVKKKIKPGSGVKNGSPKLAAAQRRQRKQPNRWLFKKRNQKERPG